MPTRFVLSVAFGGTALDELYATTIAHDLEGNEADASAGYVYLVRGLDARGLPEPCFAG